MSVLLSINKECLATVPCIHSCTVRDEKGLETIKNLSGETIREFLQNQTVPEISNSLEFDHFKNRPYFDQMDKITRFEISPVCQPEALDNSCMHFCMVICNNKQYNDTLLAPLIKRILEAVPDKVADNPWKDTDHFFKLKRSRCCTIL